MDFIEPILSIASAIYDLVENVKANKKRCHRVADRVKALEELVQSARKRKAILKSDVVEKGLQELTITLTSARDLIEKYTQASWVQRILKSGSHLDGFTTVNERLNDAFQVLSGALQVEHGDMIYEVFEISHRQKLDEMDSREDDAELKRLLLNYVQVQQDKMDAMMKEFEEVKTNVAKMVDILNKPSATNEVIRMIKPEELKYDFPQQPFMVTPTSEVYKGEYNGFTVAIKRFIDQADTSFSEINNVFNKEVQTMRLFESPNILRMFGICVKNKEGPYPEYLIIMEYCEKGSLRQVLDSDCKLSWMRKARMCLDAAKGLYRLHQTEAKSKVHGCINSDKFLVAEGYRVKLGGFELAKTETSLKKNRHDRQSRSLCYSPPQMLNSIDYPYSKECEVYSFGIVMWEIATRRHPFEDPVTKAKWTNKEMLERVGKEKYMEPLPEDCPKALGDLINACRAYESFHRPSAGVLVDKLRSVVTQLPLESP
ncbi:mixed lineage kinase domain-like protein [Boleophthalmus pectinirostris]|uniref:mixed lineage kinase domain-like protein n=1 Tax=Boleophthalmus pectinirostris TaxID=150288 RepID=UPI000A1C3699|nr:mixed lineage kinase domain-like protein [Boleophthalmus pectinirostris]